MLFGLILTTLACGFGQSASAEVVMLTHLPTLTRTPLPTLTPTLLAGAAVPAGATPGAATSLAPAHPNDRPAPDGVVVAAELESLPSVAVAPVDRANPAAPVATAAVGSPDPNTEIIGSVALAATQPRPEYIAAAPLSSVPANNLPTIASSQLINTNFKAAPTATATSQSVAVFTPTATKVPMPTSLPTATPVINVEPTTTPDFRSSGWSFASTRVDDSHDNLQLYGEIINNTGSIQELYYVSGTFYNDQGQIISDQNHTSDYAPIYNIPPGGRVPFELVVNNIDEAENFELWARSVESDDTPRQDNFKFLDVTERNEDNTYCLAGSLANRGDDLDDYVDIVAILYDDHDKVIKFGESYQDEVEDFSGETTLDFEICVDSLDAGVARYDLQAWGQ